jgi:hypothetical protein
MLLFVLLLALSCTATASLANSKLQTLELSDLLQGRRLDVFSAALATTGVMAIHSTDFEYSQALEMVCRCKDTLWQLGDTRKTLLQDGETTRTTLATATVGTTPLPLPDNLDRVCHIEGVGMHLEHLRDQLATAANAFVMALDRLINAGTTAATTPHPLLESIHGGSYSSVASIVNASTHLEHFHVYSKPALTATRGVETETSSLDWHVDAGLFLAFAPGHNCNGGTDASLYVDNSPVIFPPNTLAVMLGTGAEHWLQTDVALRATRHAVKMHPGDDRAWYGMSTCFAFRCEFSFSCFVVNPHHFSF